MTIDESMALRDAKNHLSEVVDQVEREHARVVITRHGKPAAVMVSVDDLASLEETLDIASRPRIMQQIHDSLLELDSVQVLSREQILADLQA